tara:strand:- start:431 stop:589 length:159 start_codon:yes stop_codon:yes gene_type:complete
VNKLDSKYLSIQECEVILNGEEKKYSLEEVKIARDIIYNLSLVIVSYCNNNK